MRESEDRYHNLFQTNCMAQPYMKLSQRSGQPVDYIFLKVNPAFEKMTGLKAQDILGRQVTEVLPGIENEGLIQIYGQVASPDNPSTSMTCHTAGKILWG
jgi:PAS domain S-box-containing protein